MISHCESIEKILSGCPALEDLMIKNCKWAQGCVLNVCGLKLHSQAAVARDLEYKIAIDAPALERLDVKDCISKHFLMKNLCRLVKANVDLSQTVEQFIPAGEYGNRVLEFLWGISEVQFLSLSRETMERLVQQFHLQIGVFVFNWSLPEQLPNCLLLHLKEIEIRNFRGAVDELNLVKYLLRNALS